LARQLLEGKFSEGDVILVDADNNGIIFKQTPSESPIVEAELVD
jgi:hypothetical protein